MSEETAFSLLSGGKSPNVGLRRAGLGEPGVAAALAGLLLAGPPLCTVRTIDLGENGLGDAGAALLVRALLARCPGLRLLNMVFNNLTTGGGLAVLGLTLAPAPASSGLACLDLDKNPLAPDNAPRVFALLASQARLCQVDLPAGFATPALLQAVRAHNKLTDVGVGVDVDVDVGVGAGAAADETAASPGRGASCAKTLTTTVTGAATAAAAEAGVSAWDIQSADERVCTVCRQLAGAASSARLQWKVKRQRTFVRLAGMFVCSPACRAAWNQADLPT